MIRKFYDADAGFDVGIQRSDELKAQELRIGNIAFNSITNLPSIITVMDISDIENGYKRRYGLPLTPEILLACGFEFDGELYEYTKGGDLRFTLEDGILVPHEYYTSQPFTEKAYPKYLHQLQNIIFALTGEELDVKL